MKTIILGLGNTILTDDGAGIYVVREIDTLLKKSNEVSLRAQAKQSRGERGILHFVQNDEHGIHGIATAPSGPRNDLPVTSHESRITVVEASLCGFNFIDLLAGYDRAVIVDAIHTKDGKPGEFYELDPAALKPSARLSSLHQIDFATACELAKNMGIDFPKEFAIFVMEVEDEFTFGEKPTPKVEAAIPQMAESIVEILRNRTWII